MCKSRYYPIENALFDEKILPIILKNRKVLGRPVKISHYNFFCAVLYVLRTGIPWRDLPPDFGSWHTIYTRFKRWSINGLFQHMLYRLQQSKCTQVDIAWIDSTTIAVHRHGGGSLKKRGLNQKEEDVKG